MSLIPLTSRVYFIDSRSYDSSNTQDAVATFLMYKEIQAKVIEVHAMRASFLKAKN